MSPMAKILHVMGTDAPRERIDQTQASLAGLASPGTEVEVLTMPGGPPDLEYYLQDHQSISLMLERVPARVRAGDFDAVVVSCFYDPGVRELREILDIPVVGAGEASMHVASLLGHRFSIIVGRRKHIPKMSDNALIYGFDRRIASWRAIDFTVERLKTDRVGAFEAMVREGEAAVREDRAEVVVLGCTAIEDAAPRLSERIGAPVVHPVAAGFKLAEMLGDLRARMGLSLSKICDYEPLGSR